MAWAGLSFGLGATSLGLSYFGNDDGDTRSSTRQLAPIQLPGYAESDEARGAWWNKLQEWGQKPGYGAISPEWGEIWNQAKRRVSQHYWGGVGDKGVAGKIKASAARRNVSDSPSVDAELTKLGMKEGENLLDLAIEQSVKEAEFGEQGRTNWLSSIKGLAGMKPSYYFPGQDQIVGGEEDDQMGDLATLFSGGAQIANSTQRNQLYDKYINQMMGKGKNSNYISSKNRGGAGGSSAAAMSPDFTF